MYRDNYYLSDTPQNHPINDMVIIEKKVKKYIKLPVDLVNMIFDFIESDARDYYRRYVIKELNEHFESEMYDNSIENPRI